MADDGRTQAMPAAPHADPNQTMMGSPPAADPNRTIMGTAPSLNVTTTIVPVQCPVCKTNNPPGLAFCSECGLIFEMSLDGDAFGAPAVQLPVLLDSGGREHPVRPGVTVLGRQGDIMVEDGSVSRRHAQIASTDGKIVIEDLGSTNGTKVNGDALAAGEKRELQTGDTVTLGSADLTFSLPGEANKTMMAMGGRTTNMSAAPTVDDSIAWLVVDGEEIALRKGTHSLGRRDTNDLVIADPYVSGQHGTVEVTETEVWITDNGSTNGTWVNDARLPEGLKTKLSPGDALRLGQKGVDVRWRD